MQLGRKKIGKFDVHFPAVSEFDEMYQEIFLEHAYKFESKSQAPVILDCGANIGLSVLYFKSIYPDCKIICFEPNPEVYKTLLKNISANNLADVKAVNAAIFGQDTEIDMFAERDPAYHDTLGASLIESWGSRHHATKFSVQAVRLSTYVDRPIDFVKLDIEGAEQSVLSELGEKIEFIQSLFIEFHGTNQTNAVNCINRIAAQLLDHDFNINIVHKPIMKTLPDKWHPWAQEVKPRIAVIKGEQALPQEVFKSDARGG